jgi:glutamyl-tRNA reductase
MSIVIIGTNHNFSHIELRERLSFLHRARRDALLLLKESPILEGVVILSTCNRVELYASVRNLDAGIDQLGNFLSRFHGIDKEKISPHLYIYQDKEAIRHLFMVTCGLDSLILGETQILGQVKSAFQESKEVCFTGGYLDFVFESAITFAREIHRTTAISKGRLSIGSVAIDFIKSKLGGTLLKRNVLIIGAGKITELVLRYLEDEKPGIIFISNRHFEKAKELALHTGQKAVRFDKLGELLEQADVVISATASPHFIIKRGTLENNLPPRRLIIIDLAVPRDVDPGVKEIEGVELFNLEDISSIVQNNLAMKRREAEKIEKIINQEVEILWPRIQSCEGEFFREREVSLKK